MKHNPDIHPDHYLLAEKYGVRAIDELLAKRDKAIAILYYEYGAVVASELSGWTRPTVNAAVRRNQENPRRMKL